MKMKKSVLCLLAFALIVLVNACGGGSEGDGPDPSEKGLVFSVDKDTIYKSGDDKAVFTVKYDGKDVTDKSRIFERTSEKFLDGNEFGTTKLGEFVFTAEYQGEVSQEIKIASVEEEYYQANLLLFHFTSTYCKNCPRMIYSINAAEEKAPGRLIKISFHGPMEGDDPMQLKPYAEPLMKKFNCYLTYPVVVLNGVRWWSEAKGFEDMQSFLPDKTDIGVALTTRIEGDKAYIDMNVKTMRIYDKSCRVAVVLVENSLNYEQLQDDLSWDKTYIHDDVVRRYLTDVMGDPLEEGELKAAKLLTKSYTYDISPLLVRDEVDVVAYIMKNDGTVLNCTRVKLGKSVDFQEIE